jgi:DNA adenine methylase
MSRIYRHYVEPYAGGASVLLAADPEGVSEVLNDTDGLLMDFWQVLQRPGWFDRLRRMLEATPFSREQFERSLSWLTTVNAYTTTGRGDMHVDVTLTAYHFFVLARQSLSGRREGFASLSRTRTRSGMNEQASAWMGAIAGLPDVHARLSRVVLEHRPALQLVRSEDTKQTLFYLDPPYLPETRATTGEYGAGEMTALDHADLLVALGGRKAAAAILGKRGLYTADDPPPEWKGAKPIRGKFLLSGYRSWMYDAVAKACGWTRVDFDLPNNAAGGAEKRRMTECVWKNY